MTANTSTTRRNALTSIAAFAGVGAAMTPAALAAPAATPDPIFAAIEAHKAVQHEYGNALARDPDFDTPAVKAAADAACAAHAAVLATPPTTLTGVAAVLAFAGTEMFDDDIGDSVLAYAYESGRGRLKDAARNFLPMIGETVARLSAT
jgi:hypothetical protein